MIVAPLIPVKPARRLWAVEELTDDVPRIVRWYVWQRRSTVLYRHVKSVFGGLADLTQEVYLALLRNPPPRDITKSTAICNVIRWTIARALARLKFNGRQAVLVPLDDAMLMTVMDDPQELCDLPDAVDALLRTLPARNRDIVLTLYDVIGQNAKPRGLAKELGREYKVTQERVYQLFHRSMARLVKRGQHLRWFRDDLNLVYTNLKEQHGTKNSRHSPDTWRAARVALVAMAQRAMAR